MVGCTTLVEYVVFLQVSSWTYWHVGYLDEQVWTNSIIKSTLMTHDVFFQSWIFLVYQGAVFAQNDGNTTHSVRSWNDPLQRSTEASFPQAQVQSMVTLPFGWRMCSMRQLTHSFVFVLPLGFTVSKEIRNCDSSSMTTSLRVRMFCGNVFPISLFGTLQMMYP